MTPKEKIGLSTLGVGIFFFGVAVGHVQNQNIVVKRLKSQQQLLKNAFNDLAGKVMNGTMTRDEIEAYFEEQINFVKIATKEM